MKILKIDFSPKLSSNNILISFWGDRMLNPEVLKCHEDLIALET